MSSVLRLTKINLYKHLATVNFWTPFLLAVAAVYEFASPLADMAVRYSVPVNGFSAAFVLVETYTVFIIFIGLFVLFSDLPFNDNQQMFLISRSGKRAWIFSQVLYVLIVSIMYIAFIFICFCAVLFPRLNFDSGNWGKIVKTIAATNLGDSFGVQIRIPQSVLSDFSPLESFFYSYGTALAIAVILGLVILFFNLTIKHNIGIIVSGGIIFIYMFVYMCADGYEIYYFSPLNWCSIFMADKYGVSPYPDISWVIIVLSIWLALEVTALFILGSKRVKFILDTKEEIK